MLLADLCVLVHPGSRCGNRMSASRSLGLRLERRVQRTLYSAWLVLPWYEMCWPVRRRARGLNHRKLLIDSTR